MKPFPSQAAAISFLGRELRGYGDDFYPTRTALLRLEAAADMLPIGGGAEESLLQKHVLAFGSHIRHLVTEAVDRGECEPWPSANR
jgi:hypothetical protein